MTAITLYDAPRCPFCARTRIVLAEKGVPYDTVTIDLADRPAWLVEHNPPDGRVPVLEEDGWTLPESSVIDEYLEERYPDPPLLPEDPGERAAARLLVFRFDETLGDPYYAYRREGAGAAEWLALGLGQLEAMLENVSKSYEADVETRVVALTSLLEPIMIVALGGAVGFIAMSILMPLLQMNELVE